MGSGDQVWSRWRSMTEQLLARSQTLSLRYAAAAASNARAALPKASAMPCSAGWAIACNERGWRGRARRCVCQTRVSSSDVCMFLCAVLSTGDQEGRFRGERVVLGRFTRTHTRRWCLLGPSVYLFDTICTPFSLLLCFCQVVV
jgi:hypothetical protein